MANRAFPPRAGLALGTEGLGLLQLAGGSVFTPALPGAQTPSDPGPRGETILQGSVGGAVLRSWLTRTPLRISCAPRKRVRRGFGGRGTLLHFHQLYEPQRISELLGRAPGLALGAAQRVLHLCLYLSPQPLTPPPLPLPLPSDRKSTRLNSSHT